MCRSTRWIEDKFKDITRWGDLNKVLTGLKAAQMAGLPSRSTWWR
jgi:molybdenum cofactor biosynthesis enzyme MoaA